MFPVLVFAVWCLRCWCFCMCYEILHSGVVGSCWREGVWESSMMFLELFMCFEKLGVRGGVGWVGGAYIL